MKRYRPSTYQPYRFCAIKPNPTKRLRNDSLHSAKSQTQQGARFENLNMTPDDLYDMSLRGLPRDVMENYVRIAYRDDDPSPEFVEGVLSSLSTHANASNDFQSYASPHATVVEHIPGVNDAMSGGLAGWDRPLLLPPNDSLDCANNFIDLINYMPRGILSAPEIAAIPDLFQDPLRCLEALGGDFMTTYAGLRRAIEERRFATDNSDQDLPTLGALAKRGGRVNYWNVGNATAYPEDISPIIGEDRPIHDWLYWTQLKALGDSWAPLSYITHGFYIF